MTFEVILAGIVVISGVSLMIWQLVDLLNPTSTAFEKTLAILAFLSFPVFALTLYFHTTPYYKDIDPMSEPCYSPISYEHSEFLIALHVLAILAMVVLYFREFELPPIFISIFIVLLTTGIILNALFLYQISYHETSWIYKKVNGDNASIELALFPIVITVASIGILIKLIRNKAKLNDQITYKNRWLNSINNRLQNVNNLPLASVLFTFPFLVILVLILVLFGQNVDSFANVYTETATWKLSQHEHPPVVHDRHGHYLCTVAACGSPKLVRPIALGTRHNRPILVNRQLQIANAFEYMLEQIWPTGHKSIRNFYDTYGLNLSKRINTESLSNFTYIVMKPLEWMFLISLYTYYIRPEAIIKTQYKPMPDKYKTKQPIPYNNVVLL